MISLGCRSWRLSAGRVHRLIEGRLGSPAGSLLLEFVDAALALATKRERLASVSLISGGHI